MDEAVSKLALNVAQSLPKDIHFRLVAVFDIDGDDVGLQRALVSAIKEKTDLKIVERSDLDKILKEHGMQLSDLVDRESRVKFGQLQGVEGILFGKIIEKKSGMLSASLKVHIKIDNVERGEIVMAKDFSFRAQSPYRRAIIIAGVIAGVIFLLAIWLSIRRSIKKVEKLGEDEQERYSISREVDKTISNLSQVREIFLENNHRDNAIILKDIESELRVLKQTVENTAWRGVGTEYKGAKNALKLDEAIFGSLKNINATSDQFYKEVVQKNFGNIDLHVNTLKKDIKDTLNRFRDRKEFIKY